MLVRLSAFVTVCGLFTAIGCNSGGKFSDYGDAPLSNNTDTGHSHDAVHGGQLLEFDPAHAHHAELVFDAESRDITLYFYGAEIGVGHPAEDLVFELEEGEDELHLEAVAAPLDGETADSCSRFVIAGSEVPDNIISAEQLHGHFHVLLDGQEFTGHFGHEEDHSHGEAEGHGDHDHGEEDRDGEGDQPEE